MAPGMQDQAITVTLKLYASLGQYLPDHAKHNTADVHVPDGVSIAQLLDTFHVPTEACHLVLLNGVFQPPAARADVAVKNGDALAVWPPVAGG